MNRAFRLLALVLLAAVPAAFAAGTATAQKPIKAVGSVELPDEAGDMGPISTSLGKEPPLDVVKLALRSDGKVLTIAATLKEPPGSFATSAVDLYVDTDADAATGAEIDLGEARGFEYRVELRMCVAYDDGSSACAGGSTKAKPTKRRGAVDVKRYTGRRQFGQLVMEHVVDPMGGAAGSKASVRVPVDGRVVEASVEYADLKVKPGQTIRILARESGGRPTEGTGDFPWVLLKLK